jgi:hypothetical protein
MDLTLREEYWLKLCMKLIAVISHDNYYSQQLSKIQPAGEYWSTCTVLLNALSFSSHDPKNINHLSSPALLKTLTQLNSNGKL